MTQCILKLGAENLDGNASLQFPSYNDLSCSVITGTFHVLGTITVQFVLHCECKCVILAESLFTRFIPLSKSHHSTRLNTLNYNLHVLYILSALNGVICKTARNV